MKILFLFSEVTNQFDPCEVLDDPETRLGQNFEVKAAHVLNS